MGKIKDTRNFLVDPGHRTTLLNLGLPHYGKNLYTVL